MNPSSSIQLYTTLFLKQERLLKVVICHAQSLHFYYQRHGTSEGSGNEIGCNTREVNMTQELNYYFSGPELVEAKTLSVPIKPKLKCF